MNRFLATFLCVALTFLVAFPKPAFAVEYFFNPHLILTDEEMSDHTSMSLASIQRFLEDKGSGLAHRSFPDFLGITKPASEIIWQAAVESQINPRVLLATLQKEQSLIGDPNPSERQLDRAMGYRCPDGGSCHPNTLDFGKQVDGAAWQFRQYLDRPQDWFYKAGQTYEIDGIHLITPATTATAGLYSYTPHYSGNERFWRIYQDYFGIDFPDGSLVKADGEAGVWLVEFGTRRLITSWGVLLSRFDPDKILTISKSDLEKYVLGPSIRFHNFSLLGLPDGDIYLLVGDELRHITSLEVFRTLGFNPEEVIPAEEIDLAGFSYGRDITVESAYPTGALVQNNETGGVYFVENGIKKPIIAREIMDVEFPNRVLTAVSPDILNQYEEGSPVQFSDGTLIRTKNGSEVYVISDGFKRWVKTEEAFAKFGYKWNNVIVVPEQVLQIHPLGEEVT